MIGSKLVFLSSATAPLREERALLEQENRRSIGRAGFEIVALEYDDEPGIILETIRSKLAKTHLFILLLDREYGSAIKGRNQSWTEYEFRFAHNLYRNRRPFRLRRPKIIVFQRDEAIIDERQRQFVSSVTQGEEGWKYFPLSSPHELVGQVKSTILDLKCKEATRWKVSTLASLAASILLERGMRFVQETAPALIEAETQGVFTGVATSIIVGLIWIRK